MPARRTWSRNSSASAARATSSGRRHDRLGFLASRRTPPPIVRYAASSTTTAADRRRRRRPASAASRTSMSSRAAWNASAYAASVASGPASYWLAPMLRPRCRSVLSHSADRRPARLRRVWDPDGRTWQGRRRRSRVRPVARPPAPRSSPSLRARRGMIEQLRGRPDQPIRSHGAGLALLQQVAIGQAGKYGNRQQGNRLRPYPAGQAARATSIGHVSGRVSTQSGQGLVLDIARSPGR